MPRLPNVLSSIVSTGHSGGLHRPYVTINNTITGSTTSDYQINAIERVFVQRVHFPKLLCVPLCLTCASNYTFSPKF